MLARSLGVSAEQRERIEDTRAISALHCDPLNIQRIRRTWHATGLPGRGCGHEAFHEHERWKKPHSVHSGVDGLRIGVMENLRRQVVSKLGQRSLHSENSRRRRSCGLSGGQGDSEAAAGRANS
eukprot:EG_transcript_41727